MKTFYLYYRELVWIAVIFSGFCATMYLQMLFAQWRQAQLPSPPTGAGVYIEGDHVYLDPDQGKEDDDDE